MRTEGQDCHVEVKRIGAKNEIAWFKSFGIDPHNLERGLGTVTNDRDRMLNVLLVHKEQADASRIKSMVNSAQFSGSSI